MFNLTLDEYKHAQTPLSNLSANPLSSNMLIGGPGMKYFNLLHPELSDQVDWKAPGVREAYMNPPISMGPFRSAMYDRQRPGNQAPIPDYNDTLGEMEVLFGPWAQRVGASNFEMLQEGLIFAKPTFQTPLSNPRLHDSIAYTGVSPLKNFRPNSTLQFIN